MLHSTWPVVYCCLKLDHLCWHISNLEYCIILFCTLCQKLVHAVLPFPDGITTSILINVKSLLMEDVTVMRTTLKQRMSVKETAMQVLVQKVGTCTTHFLQWKGCMRKKPDFLIGTLTICLCHRKLLNCLLPCCFGVLFLSHYIHVSLNTVLFWLQLHCFNST